MFIILFTRKGILKGIKILFKWRKAIITPETLLPYLKGNQILACLNGLNFEWKRSSFSVC